MVLMSVLQLACAISDPSLHTHLLDNSPTGSVLHRVRTCHSYQGGNRGLDRSAETTILLTKIYHAMRQ